MASSLLPLLLVLVVATSTTRAGRRIQCEETGSECGSTVSRGVTASDKTEILTAHNTIRQIVKNGVYAASNLPAARAMPGLTWDTSLAEMAQRWAGQCRFSSGSCDDEPRFGIGQNVLFSRGVTLSKEAPKNWTDTIAKGWFAKELPNFKQQGLTFGGRGNTGPTSSMTQVIWAATDRVGCGYMAHSDDSFPGLGELTSQHYVCQYAPTGNVVDGTIYIAQ